MWYINEPFYNHINLFRTNKLTYSQPTAKLWPQSDCQIKTPFSCSIVARIYVLTGILYVFIFQQYIKPLGARTVAYINVDLVLDGKNLK